MSGAGIEEGGMVAVSLSQESSRGVVDAAAEKVGDELEVAAVNSERDIVFSGSLKAVSEFENALAEMSGDGVRSARVRVEYGYHSQAFATASTELERLLEGCALVKGRGKKAVLGSSVHGRVMSESGGDEVVSGSYWALGVRKSVEFGDALGGVAEAVGGMSGVSSVSAVEVAGHPVMSFSIRRVGGFEVVESVMRRGEGRGDSIGRCVGRLWESGVVSGVGSEGGASASAGAGAGGEAGKGLKFVSGIPVYQWQRERVWWPESSLAVRVVSGSGVGDLGEGLEELVGGTESGWNAVLGRRVVVGGGETEVWVNSTDEAEWMDLVEDHVVGGAAVVPAAWMIGAVGVVVRERRGAGEMSGVVAHDVRCSRLFFADEGLSVQLVYDGRQGEVRGYERRSGGSGGEQWRQFVRAGVSGVRDRGADEREIEGVVGSGLIESMNDVVSRAHESGKEVESLGAVYDQFAASGLEYGARFQTLKSAWVVESGKEVVSIV